MSDKVVTFTVLESWPRDAKQCDEHVLREYSTLRARRLASYKDSKDPITLFDVIRRELDCQIVEWQLANKVDRPSRDTPWGTKVRKGGTEFVFIGATPVAPERECLIWYESTCNTYIVTYDELEIVESEKFNE